jgi:hypothetical protein
LAAPVGLAFDHEFPGGGLQPVVGGLGEQGVGERGQPFGGAVGGDDGGRLVVPFDGDLVEVGGLSVVGLVWRAKSSMSTSTATSRRSSVS